ncbi:hypothetical protein MICAF_5210003 [Microcystis aeruginosa PCC 9807]|uniref:Uncharacterized protein n=1 Tax=Microcystis aeruginosa PCC 9807 TaxID=1160283 RepID=I4HBZ7_MICAE|nr:hypothetical protein MICAF_5210003 [Microcystis aeruginosa PCC 9807]
MRQRLLGDNHPHFDNIQHNQWSCWVSFLNPTYETEDAVLTVIGMIE